MGLEHGVDPLPGEHPAWGRMRFVCDHCGEPMLSSEGVALELPVEHGGEAEENMFEFSLEGDKPAPVTYYLHKVGCEWYFIHERGWTPEHYTSRDIKHKD